MADYEAESGHRAYRCVDCNKPGTCMFCDGGLFLCTVCGALEGALLPKCPGRKLTTEEHDANYAHYCNQTGPFAVDAT